MTQSLAEMLSAVEVVDLTQPLSEDTPVLKLPPPFANTPGLTRHEISRYDDRGPAWAWDWLEIGEHVGTHFDAPIHWVSGKDGEDVASVPPQRLVGPAVVIDKSAEAAADPDFCLTVDHIREFEAEHGPLPENGWLLLRTGWDARAHDEAAFLNANETGPHTPGFDVECARWIAEESPLVGRRRRDGRHRRGRRALLRPAVPGPQLPARRGQVRPDPARQPRAAAAHGRRGGRRAAQARARHGQPRPRARARPARLSRGHADEVRFTCSAHVKQSKLGEGARFTSTPSPIASAGPGVRPGVALRGRAPRHVSIPMEASVRCGHARPRDQQEVEPDGCSRGSDLAVLIRLGRHRTRDRHLVVTRPALLVELRELRHRPPPWNRAARAEAASPERARPAETGCLWPCTARARARAAPSASAGRSPSRCDLGELEQGVAVVGEQVGPRDERTPRARAPRPRVGARAREHLRAHAAPDRLRREVLVRRRRVAATALSSPASSSRPWA